MQSIIVSAACAGFLAIAITVAIERWGGRIGGLLGTLPSTIVPAAIGIWARSATLEDFQRAMSAVPVGMFLNAIFLWSFRSVPPLLPTQLSTRTKLAATSTVALIAWAGLASAGVWGIGSLSQWMQPLWLASAASIALVAIGILGCLRDLPTPPGRHRVAYGVLIARGALAAASIGAAVWLTRQGAWAGIFATFPAIFLTTMVSLWLSQGQAVPVGAVGPMMLGSGSIAGFSILSMLTFPVFGAAGGTALSWAGAALLFTLPSWVWLRRRARRKSDT